MRQKKSMTAAGFIFLFFSFAWTFSLYANNSMMPQIPREVTEEDDHLAWTVPSGWKDLPPSGMRLGSFTSLDPADGIDVSIILLGSAAGAVEPNLERWAGQIDAPQDASSLKKIMEQSSVVKTGLGKEVKVFDFALLQNAQETSAKSMIVSIIPLEKAACFIKMTGTIGALAKNKKAFTELLASVRRK